MNTIEYDSSSSIFKNKFRFRMYTELYYTKANMEHGQIW
jgi:hypothetical protein